MKIFKVNSLKSLILFIGIVTSPVILSVLFLYVTAVFFRGYDPIQDGFFCDGALPEQPAIFNQSKSWSVSQKEVLCDGPVIHHVYLTKYGEPFNRKKLIFSFTEEWDMNYDKINTDNLMSWIKWDGDGTLLIKKIATYEITTKEYFFENIRIKYDVF